ncbi:MAG: SLBB domain-containing protein [Oscillospiraceae bacterium]|nr:SLBB domain-containing protein [Oscillospiraceae bacterium]
MSNFLELIERAGVVGCGGAGFPAHIKFNTTAEIFIVNAAECEPLLATDRYLLREKAAQICAAAQEVRRHLGANQCVVATKETYTAEIAALNAVLPEYPNMRLHLMTSFYPAGDEQIMVFEVTGRVVPPRGLPRDVGCVVSNAATLLAVHDAMQGIAFTEKYLTIGGEVNDPKVIKVPVGTSFGQCLELAGGSKIADYVIVSGGPMMGKVHSLREGEELSVTKTTSGFLVLPAHTKVVRYARLDEEQTLRRARAACIQCSFCTQLCPRYLLGHPLEPHRIMRKISCNKNWRANLAHDKILQCAVLCCECGICELYSCPMQLQPRKINALIKQEIRKNNIDLPKFELDSDPRPYRQLRKVPTRKAAVRAGVG